MCVITAPLYCSIDRSIDCDFLLGDALLFSSCNLPHEDAGHNSRLIFVQLHFSGEISAFVFAANLSILNRLDGDHRGEM